MPAFLRPRTLSVRLYTRRQMERLFDRAGLEVESVRGWGNEGRFRRTFRRMVIVGRNRSAG